MKKNARIFLAGHRGMVGSALFRILKNKGYENSDYWRGDN